MKKYVFEATKKQCEKPTELKQYFVRCAAVTVYAENEDEAKKLAEDKLRREYLGTGTIPVSYTHLVQRTACGVTLTQSLSCVKGGGKTQVLPEGLSFFKQKFSIFFLACNCRRWLQNGSILMY